MTARRRYRRGFTVLEVVVYSALSLALLGGVSMYIQSGLRMFRGGQAYRDTQQSAVLTLKKMTADVFNSTAGKEAGGGRVIVPGGNDLIEFPSADGLLTAVNHDIWLHDDKTGELFWRKWVLLRLDTNQHTITRYEQGMTSCQQSDIPTPPGVSSFGSAPEMVGHNIEQAGFSWLVPEQSLEARLVAFIPSKTGARDGTRIEMRTSVHIEN